MMKAGAAESAPLLQKLDETNETPKPGAIAAAARQAKRGVGVFGVALALSGVLCPVPLTVRGTQALVSFAPLAFKLFYAARHNAVLRRSPFPPP